ncbi:hypothetical protein MMC25_002688 [Agyrium rufum]|nr:hypothetical protein [Agyrium rufum]
MTTSADDSRRYFVNNGSTLLTVSDPVGELRLSLTRIVTECPPQRPWPTTYFQDKPSGLWTGPTAISYIFFYLSRKSSLQELLIRGKTPKEWTAAYLDCGSDSHPIEGNGIGVKNEYLAWRTMKAVSTQEPIYVEELAKAAEELNRTYDPLVNEHLSGRAGTLALLRIVRYFLPEAAERMNSTMKPIIEHMLAENKPWTFHGHEYLGAAHGAIGNITQIVLCDPTMASALEPSLLRLLDMQQPNNNWWVSSKVNSDSELVHYCHGAPGFVISLVKIKSYFSTEAQTRITRAIELGRQCTWERGILKKEPNLCHGVTGNALALEGKQREHFLAMGTREMINSDRYLPGDDQYGLLWGEAGRAWGWMVLVLREDGIDYGWPTYTDI